MSSQPQANDATPQDAAGGSAPSCGSAFARPCRPGFLFDTANAAADFCYWFLAPLICILTIVGLLLFVFCCVVGETITNSRNAYKITQDDIDLLKDAAAFIGPGDPIARGLWRLAERIEQE